MHENKQLGPAQVTILVSGCVGTEITVKGKQKRLFAVLLKAV
jgi:hypothetical protein